MSGGMKGLLVGCVIVIFVGIVAVVGGGYFVKNWLHKESEKVGNLLGTENSEYGKKVAELKKKYPFTPPADNLITEDQLVRFLSVRKALYSVWKQHESEFKEMARKQEKLSSAMKGLEVMQEVRKVQVVALDQARMSQEEYGYLDSSVYGIATRRMLDHVPDEFIQSQLDNLNKALEDPHLSESDRQKLLETKRQFDSSLAEKKKSEQAEIDREMAAIPPQNAALFKLHQQEIDQYWMEGLQSLGM
ncbi:MAG TPA: hypothetical protein VLR94_03140 [Acidobacteriota bacterium]|nr:hypothetical protein [Acidobacteriota bacterium]